MARPRRKTRITYEGVTFLLILSFIVLGSILRQINLLVLLSGLMIAPFFFNWRISRKMLERVSFLRRLPASAHAGTPFKISWDAKNGNRKMPAWNVRFEDRVRPEGASDKESTKCGAVLEQVSPGSSQSGWYECLMSRRGLYEIGPARAGSSFPLGLVSTSIDIPVVDTLVVAPELVPLGRAFLARLESTRRNAHNAGSRRKGVVHEEFFSLRGWQSGDNRRFVHWRSSAKRDELLVRQGVEPDDTQTYVLFDFARADTESESATELLASICASILCHASSSRKGSPPSLGIFDGLPDNSQPAVASLFHTGPASNKALLRKLAVVRSVPVTGILEGARSIIAHRSNSCRVFVLSTRSLQSAMQTEPDSKQDIPLAALTWVDVTCDPQFSHLRGQNESADETGSSPAAAKAGFALEVMA
jgi:Protein of unknown function DUF58